MTERLRVERRKLHSYLDRTDLTFTERHTIRGALLSLDWMLGRDILPPSERIDVEACDL